MPETRLNLTNIDFDRMGLTLVDPNKPQEPIKSSGVPGIPPQTMPGGLNSIKADVPDIDIERMFGGEYVPPEPEKPTLSKITDFGLGVAKRSLGVGIGTLNAPSAFLWGMMGAEYEGDRAEFDKMPWWQQQLVNLGGGFMSALESISTPEKWGKQWEDYYKGVTGMTPAEDLAHSLEIRGMAREEAERWASLVGPALTVTGNIISDPMLLLPQAKAMANLRVPKGYVGVFPKRHLEVLKQIRDLDDKAVKEEVKRILERAYSDRLWGIQEGATFESVVPSAARPPRYPTIDRTLEQPVIKSVPRGGIVEGETFQNVLTPQAGPDLRSGGAIEGETWTQGLQRQGVTPRYVHPAEQQGIIEGATLENLPHPAVPIGRTETIQRPPGAVISGGDIPPKTSLNPMVDRILEIARQRYQLYMQEATLARHTGVSALQFINKVRSRLGLPTYDNLLHREAQMKEAYGPFADKMLERSVDRRPPVQVGMFDLGALVKAAKDTFGWDNTLTALRILEAEDSALGRTIKAALPELEATYGSGQFVQETVEQVGKVAGAKAAAPPIAKTGVKPTKAPKVAPKEVETIVERPAPKTLKEEADQVEELTGAKLDLEDIGERTTVEGEDLGVIGAAPTVETPVVVPGNTYKHIVPKPGMHLPGVGDIQKVFQERNGIWYVQYLDEVTHKLRLKHLDDVMGKVQATAPPRGPLSNVTLDFLGFQGMFERLVNRLDKLRADSSRVWSGGGPKEPFQFQIPENKLKTPDWDQIVKHRRRATYRGQPLYAPAVRGEERNIVMNANELPGGVLGEYTKLLQNPDRVMEYAGAEVKELFLRPIREAEDLVSRELHQIDNWMSALRKTVGFKSIKRIALYGISKQRVYLKNPVTKEMEWYNDGMERLKAMGYKSSDIPKLTENEMNVYNALRAKWDELYDRTSVARVMSGYAPFPKVEHYTTFVNDFKLMQEMGHNPVEVGEQVMQQFMHPNLTTFKYAKPRGKEPLPLELDLFWSMSRYIEPALRHIHMSPRISKLRELLRSFPDPSDPTGKTRWQMSQTHPRLFEYLNRWLTFQSGVVPKTGFFDTGLTGRLLRGLNKNLTAALISYNLRVVGIQPSALRNTVVEIGPKYTYLGVQDLARSAVNRELWNEAMNKSKVLHGRSYDVSIKQALDAIESGKWGHAKELMTRVGMKPTQWFDVAAAWATWRGGYRKALADGLSESKAINYADDLVVKTQASGARSAIAPIQQTTLGRLASLLQTFVINDWNFLMTDVLGVGNPRLRNADRLGRVFKYMAATTLLNAFYEDVLQMNSPFPSPLRAAGEALDRGADMPSASWEMIKEAGSQLPIVGGAFRYRSGSPFGPAGATVEELRDLVYSPDFGKAIELGSKITGMPGTAQLSRAVRAAKRGEDIWPMIAGKPTKESKPTREKGGIRGIKGIKGIRPIGQE